MYLSPIVGFAARHAFLRLAAGLLALLAMAAIAQDAPYGRVRVTSDGIGKTYHGREIAQVMGWQGAAWLERDSRDRDERSDRLLRALRLEPGMDVADIGAGTGFYARRIARRVMPDGKVHAVDVQPQMVAMLRKSAQQEGLDNLLPVQGTAIDPGLEPASIDLALMVDVYHELEFPHEMLQATIHALRPGGRLVLVEYRAEDRGLDIKPLHKMSEKQIRREVESAALRWERTASSLPLQHLVVFRKAGVGPVDSTARGDHDGVD